MIRSKYIALVSVSLACAGAVVMPAGRAFAEDQAAIDKLVQMNKKALGDYDTLEWDSAKRTLLDALVAGKKAGLDNHPIMARTYVHLAAVYLTGFKDRTKALQSFARALEIDPTIQLSKGIETAEVSAAFAEAQRKSGGGAGGGSSAGGDDNAPPSSTKRRRHGPIMEGDTPPPSEQSRRKPTTNDEEEGEPDLPARIGALDCPTPDEAIIDRPLILRCAVAPRLPVASVYLLYRAPGKEDYIEVAMTKTPKGWLQAKVPKKAVNGKSFQFYFEGRNADGKPVVANGGADSPNIVLVVEEESKGEAAKATPGEEDENPLEDDEGPKGPRIHLGHVDKAREGLDTRFGKRKWWIGIGAGTGYGYAKGNGFEAVNKSPDPSFHMLQSEFQPGLAWAGIGHLAPEFGYQLNPDIALALEGRLQWTGQPAKYAQFAARGAIAVLAKLMFFSKQSQLRFFGSVLAGGGDGFRLVVYPDAGASNKFTDFKDTIRGGPVVAGLGGGLNYEASKAVSLVAEINALGGFPIFSAVVDLNLALQINIY